MPWLSDATGNPPASVSLLFPASRAEGGLCVCGLKVIRWQLQLQISHLESEKNTRLPLRRLCLFLQEGTLSPETSNDIITGQNYIKWSPLHTKDLRKSTTWH